MTVVAIAAILLGLGYTALLRRRAREQLWPWWTTLVATFLSVLLGILAGIWVYERQSQETVSRDREALRLLLQAELSDNYITLKFDKPLIVHLGTEKHDVHAVVLQNIILEKAGASGLFDTVDSYNMLYLARRIKLYNVSGDLFHRLVSATPQNEELVRNSATQILRLRAATLNNIEQLATQLRLDIRNGRRVWPPVIYEFDPALQSPPRIAPK